MSLPNEHEDEKPDEEECAICSNDLVEEFSRPEPCYHRFHTPCITTWAGIRLTCPMCREKFKRIFTYSLENKEHPKLTSTEVFEPPEEDVLEQIEMTTGINPYEHTVCHLCGGGDNEDQILLCDGCDEGFHMYCLSPAVTRIPSGTWMCPECSSAMRVTERVSHANHSVATRTAVLSRIAAIVARRLNIRSDSEDSEEEDDFSTMDAAVLNDNLEPGTSNLPPVERRKRKKAQSTGVKQRRKRRTKRQRKKENKLLKNLDEEQRRGSKEERAEVSRLSINGSRADYPFFEDEQQERSAPGSPDETESEKCDLLGSILSEQEKVLANGKLFKVEGGKFKETEEFEKYREKLHKKMDKQHKKRIGMPVEEEEQDKKEWQPSSSNAKEPNDGLMIDDREIDHEVEEQLAQMASDEREDRERELLDAQRKALADQKREELAKKVEKNRERERADREKKKLERDREKSQKEEAIIQLGRDRDRERKEREEKRGREREREDEKRRAREVEADKAKREVEEKRRRDRNERRRSRSRSPRRRDERRRGDRDRTSREVSRDDRNDRDENRHSRSDRNKDREKQRPSASTTVQMGQANGQAPPPPSNGALPRPFVPNQARPDMSAIFAAVPGLNPFLPNFGLQLANPTTQMLLAQQQQLVALGALPGGIPMPLPLTGNGIGLPGSIAPTQPTNQPSKGEESKRNEEDKKKGHAVKIIEGHSIRLVTAYFRKEKITREQYKNIMKQLVKEFRNSRSIDELKSAKCKEVIEERAKELLRPFD